MTTPELIAAIRLTNNGYIFAPTAAELTAARNAPGTFQMVNNSYGSISIAMWPR